MTRPLLRYAHHGPAAPGDPVDGDVVDGDGVRLGLALSEDEGVPGASVRGQLMMNPPSSLAK